MPEPASFRPSRRAPAGNEDLPAAMRIDRIRDQAVDRRRRTAIEPVRQYRIDDRAFQHAMQRAGIVDRIAYA